MILEQLVRLRSRISLGLKNTWAQNIQKHECWWFLFMTSTLASVLVFGNCKIWQALCQQLTSLLSEWRQLFFLPRPLVPTFLLHYELLKELLFFCILSCWRNCFSYALWVAHIHVTISPLPPLNCWILSALLVIVIFFQFFQWNIRKDQSRQDSSARVRFVHTYPDDSRSVPQCHFWPSPRFVQIIGTIFTLPVAGSWSESTESSVILSASPGRYN